jgi:RNA polymerase sigma-70 factor (ECF subfamily)
LPNTDEELLVCIQQGEKLAFNELFSRYDGPLRARLCNIVQDGEIAEDILQEVFIRVWNKAATWEGRGSVRSWLYTIATHLAFNYLRSVRRRPELSLDEPIEQDDVEEGQSVIRQLESTIPGPAAQFEESQTRALVQNLIDDLPEARREAMYLVHCEDLSVQEAADALGVPAGTVKSRLFYGRKAIEDLLKSYLKE